MRTRKRSKDWRTTHGMSHTQVYSAWHRMRQRCQNPSDRSFKNYGGRGIKVCKRWSRFESFYRDMGDPWLGASLDRINNNGGYYPENCRWADWFTQLQNTRKNVFLTINGETHCISEWSRKRNIHIETIRTRLRKGWDHERAISAVRPHAPYRPRR